MAFELTPPRDVSWYGDPKDHGARCDLCPLNGNVFVPYSPPTKKLRLVLVGEGPGRKECIQRTPFCLVPETLVLMADLTWKPLGNVLIGEQIITVQEEPDSSTGVSGAAMRTWVVATITNKIEREDVTTRLEMGSGRELIGTSDHRVLTESAGANRRWLPIKSICAKETVSSSKVRINTRSSAIVSIGAPWIAASTYDAGWLAGFFDGEGHVRGSKRVPGELHGRRAAGQVGFSQNVGPVADYAVELAQRLGFDFTSHRYQVEYTGNKTIRAHIAGGFLESLRFLGTVRPIRLIKNFLKVIQYVHIRGLPSDPVMKKHPAGFRKVIDITTTAGTFIANGFVVHNCGPTGQILNEELRAVGLDREEAWTTNATLCVGETDQENERAAECCAPRLLKELAALPSDVPIVAMGKAATRAVLGVKSILIARGFVWTARDFSASITAGEAAFRKAEKENKKVEEVKLRLDTVKGRHALAGRIVFPALHPTFAFIHSEVWADIFRIDLDRAARWIRGELNEDMLADKVERVTSLSALKRRKRTFLVTDNVDEIRAAMKLLGKEVGCDIETERLKPLSPLLVQIFTVQISDGDRSIVIAPWDKARHAALLSEVLKGRTTVWHNGFCFDQPALEKDSVSFEGAQIEDTLTAHHSFASCFPQKLDHVVSTFLDSSPWKIRFGVRGAEEKGLAPTQGEEGDLEAYGATDAIVTIKAWRAMQADLAPERAVYEHDKRRSILYKSLQVAGYPVDRRRKRLLSKLLKRRAASLKGRLRQLARRPNFQPSKLGDVRHVLFHTLRAPMLNPTATGLASTSNATLESLRTGDKGDDMKETRVARFAEGMLNWRVTLKSKNTYLDPVIVHPDGRAHYTFKPFGVITGRPASRILSAPRWSKALPERVREIYKAEPGRALVYFDLAQAEARFAAALSGDPNFIAAVAGDIHTTNAKILFPDAREMLERDAKGKNCPRHSSGGLARAACNCGKPYRDPTKNAFFAIIYQGQPARVLAFLRSQGLPVELDDIELMFASVRDVYAVHDQWVKDIVRFVEKNGFLRTALMNRKIVMGFHPKPSDSSNAPIQSGIADVIDRRLLDVMVPSLPPGAKMIMHHYDSATFDVATKDVDKVQCIVEDCWKEPVRLKDSIVCRGEREFLLPAEVKCGKRWSDF